MQEERAWQPRTAGQSAGAGIRPSLFYGVTGVLMLTNALAVGALFMSSDISRFLSGHNEMLLAAYEDRISELRVAVDQLYSRNYAQTGNINLQLQDLAHRQQELAEQHQLVRALASKASELGIAAAEVSHQPTKHSSALAADALTGMQAESRSAIAGIARSASKRTRTIISELEGLGIQPELPPVTIDGVGGPFFPAVAVAPAVDMVTDANVVMDILLRYEAARKAADAAPVHSPIAGTFRQSSNYGNRRDPFTGRGAFHAGMDFAAASGTQVRSAGTGIVSFAGKRSGYGNIIEITHTATGLVSRYAHLSVILVKQGQAISTGLPIGKVGSTGRSTGPHLHFEVRRGDRPMNPKPFLDAGERLRNRG